MVHLWINYPRNPSGWGWMKLKISLISQHTETSISILERKLFFHNIMKPDSQFSTLNFIVGHLVFKLNFGNQPVFIFSYILSDFQNAFIRPYRVVNKVTFEKFLPPLIRSIFWPWSNMGGNYRHVEIMESAVKIMKDAVKPWNLRWEPSSLT